MNRDRAWMLVALACLALVLFLLPQREPTPARAGADVGRPADAAAEGRPDPSLAPPGGGSVARERASLSGAARAAEAPGAGTSIRGTVLDPDGQPLEDARCTLRPSVPAWGFSNGAPTPGGVQSESTDAAGRFAFAVEEGFWRLEVAAERFAPAVRDHLRPGDERQVQLAPSSTLLVRVRDVYGAAVPGAVVELAEGGRDVEEPALESASTGEDGTAELKPLAPGRRYVRVSHADHPTAVDEVNLGIRAWQEHEVVLESGIALVGRVRAEPPERTLTDARVRVEAFSRGQSILLEVPCGEDGAFRTPPAFLSGERVRLAASAPGFAPSTLDAFVRPDRAARPRAGHGEKRVELTLSLAEARLRGRVVDGAGSPLAGVGVCWTSIEPVARGMEALTTALASVTPHPERWRRAPPSDASGTFEVRGLGPGRQYVLLLTADSFGPRTVWAPLLAPGEVHDLGDAALSRAGSLFGRALYDDGAPAAGLRVRALLEIVLSEDDFDSDFDSWRPSRWWRPLSAETSSDGGFRIDPLAPGWYDVELSGSAAESVEVRAGRATGPLEVVVPRDAGSGEPEACEVPGTVRDAEGRPLESVFAALFERGAPTSDPEASPLSVTFTDFRGAFRLSAPADTACTLLISDMRGVYVVQERELEPARGMAPVEVRLQLDSEPSEPLLGYVFDLNGNPLPGMDVALEPPENRYCGCISFLAKTDENGIVVYERVAAGEHRVVVSDPTGRYRAKEVRERLGPGDTFEVYLTP